MTEKKTKAADRYSVGLTGERFPPTGEDGAWFWSPHGSRDSHIPECYPIIHFTEELLPENR